MEKDQRPRFYVYKWNPVVKGTHGWRPEESTISIRVKPESRKDMSEALTGRYRKRPVPLRARIDYTISQSEYSVHFFFNTESMEKTLRSFYGAHSETKADFIVKMDAEGRDYGLSLYRQGLKEPVVIPESAYQLIVFKNNFEDYRSKNYNQPRGAWIW